MDGLTQTQVIKFYRVKQASPLLGTCDETTRRWLRDGKLKGRKVGHSFRISEDEIARVLREGLPV